MAAIETSWILGSATISGSATFVVGGSDAAVTGGTKYLRDATDALSWLYAIQTAIAGVAAGSTVTILQNRRIKIDYNGASKTLVVPASMQALLGFTSSPYAAATSHTAENVSTLLWSPAWPETPIGHPVGTEGYEVPNWEQTSSASGLTVRTVEYGTAAKLTELFWAQVQRERVWTTNDGEPGEFRRFWRDVYKPGYRWKLYSGIMEDASSSSAVEWTTALGPYKVRDLDARWWNRAVQQVDLLSNITMKGTLTSELS